MTPELRAQVLEGQIRVKQLDELIGFLTTKRAGIARWLAKHGQPDLLPTEAAPVSYTAEFETLWKLYPARPDGFKREKKAAFTRYKSMKKLDQGALERAIKNYAKSPEVRRGFARDMMRFLKPDFWEAWINPTPAMMTMTEKGQKNEGSNPNLERTVDEAIRKAAKPQPAAS